ncbi:MAG: molybdopterin-dependent oxidoreductase [Ignavibacteriae bacterium]|nr:molybdopterin-dependent oxidoreductase [Ignavibacteriota bacterium]
MKNKELKNQDSIRHVRGESLFLDDFSVPEGTLYAVVFASPESHGIIRGLDITGALAHKGVKAIFTYKDIPGVNQIGGIIKDEELLAVDKVEFTGQPVALVIAESAECAREARNKIKINIEKLEAITEARDAFAKGSFITSPQIFACGDTEEAFTKCDVVIEGTAESGGQEHLYLETQAALALPAEGGNLKIISSTQNPTAIQRITADVLGISYNKIESEVLRLGGGFGGKEDQATPWAVLAGLACYHLRKPVKLVLNRHDDMYMTGKRHPYSSDYKLGFSKEGKLIAYEVSFYQNSGAAADLSTAILERSLSHCTNTYFIPNVKATGYCCKTNLPPNTAFRGFGGPQGMFVLESAIHKAAKRLGLEPHVIQSLNLLKEGDAFPYGQKTENCNAGKCWSRAVEKYNLQHIAEEVSSYNNTNKLYKKGYAVMPICFGISFTQTALNQAGALVHIYTDGSVSISTGAVEMGQGVNMKLRQVAAEIFSINADLVKSETTNTTRVANTSATAASTGADLNGKAVEQACRNLYSRLMIFASQQLSAEVSSLELKDERIYSAGKPTELTWSELITRAYWSRIDMTSHEYYAAPGVFFDRVTGKGNPFAYHVYGTAIIEALVDCLRGTYKIESVKMIHDFGSSFNNVIDKSQAEGALMQGLGWMTMEEIVYNSEGRLITNSLSAYKVPDINFTPDEIDIEFLSDSVNPQSIFNSKAIGEPPLMYGIGAYFAIRNAMQAYRPEADFDYTAPIAPERALLNLYKKAEALK